MDLRVGVVIDVRQSSQAGRPVFLLLIDFGPLGAKRASAPITRRYRAEDLIGRQVIAAIDPLPTVIGSFVTEVRVLGAPDGTGEMVLLRPDHGVVPGTKIG